MAIRRLLSEIQYLTRKDAPGYSDKMDLALNRKALVMTDTELKLMAAAAMIGLSTIPNTG